MRTVPAMRTNNLTADRRMNDGRVATNSLNLSKNAHLHVDISICPRRHPGHGPRLAENCRHEDMSQNAPLSVPYLAMLNTETPKVSLVTMLDATSEDVVGEFVTTLLAPKGWEVEGVRKRASRLEPPDRYWAMFEIQAKSDARARSLRLVARGAFGADAWEDLQARLQRHTGQPPDPIDGLGYPTILPESQVAFWFYPCDPAMPGLPEAAVGDILRYRFATSAGPLSIYGKVQPGDRGLRTQKIVEGLWRSKVANSDGLLNLPRPLGFIDRYGLLLEQAIPGAPVQGNRRSNEFKNAALAAAEAVAVVHESGVETDIEILLDAELERLDRVAHQFAYVHPQGHFLLSDLIVHLRNRARVSFGEEWRPTHGDLKYDQFVHHNGRYTLLDFDYYGLAETSYDLGKFCAYLVPSNPQGWEDTVAAEAARVGFLRRYLELRPHATVNRFPIYEALQLALRALSFMWAQQHGWERIAETFLVMAHERLYSRFPEV